MVSQSTAGGLVSSSSSRALYGFKTIWVYATFSQVTILYLLAVTMTCFRLWDLLHPSRARIASRRTWIDGDKLWVNTTQDQCNLTLSKVHNVARFSAPNQSSSVTFSTLSTEFKVKAIDSIVVLTWTRILCARTPWNHYRSRSARLGYHQMNPRNRFPSWVAGQIWLRRMFQEYWIRSWVLERGCFLPKPLWHFSSWLLERLCWKKNTDLESDNLKIVDLVAGKSHWPADGVMVRAVA